MFLLFTKQFLRTHRKKLVLITTLIAGALSLFVSIGLFVSNVNNQIRDQTKPLVGADIIISSSQPLSSEAQQLIDTLTQQFSTETTDRITFSTNLTLSGTEANLVQVQGIEPNYPLYGTMAIRAIADTATGAWVDSQTYTQYVQDNLLRIGTAVFPVAGIIEKRASASINIFDEGRIVLLPYAMIATTQLTNIGSRVSYETLIRVNDTQYASLLEQLQAAPELSGIAQITDGQRRIDQVQRLTNEFDRFITIVLIITFVLVATTIFISVRTFFTHEQRTIGILKILGQSSMRMTQLYGSMFACCFIIGIIVACGIGVLSIQLFDMIPLTEEFIIYPIILRETVIIGCILALITVTLPLYTAASTPGLALLRPHELPKKSLMYKQTILLGIGIYSMYVVTLQDWVGGLLFLGGFALCVGLFSQTATSLLRLLKRRSSTWGRKRYLVYDGIRTSVAPGNQTVLMSIGLCISIISLLVISGVSSSFLERLTTFSEEQPSLYILNILPEDVSYITQTYPDAQLYDVILSRIQTINGVPLQAHLAVQDQGGERSAGGYTREFNVTTIAFAKDDYLKGNAPGIGEVSLEKGFADGLQIALGDTIEFFIQGRSFDLQVTSLRKEERTGGPFFFIQFPATQFEEAPKTYFWTTDIPNEQKTGFKQVLIEELGPHLSFVDADDIISTIQAITTDLTRVIRVLFSFLLFFVFVSIYVCLQAMKTLKQQKIRLYGLLGATIPMIKKSLFSEQIAIFGMAFASGLLIAVSLIWLILSRSELLGWSLLLILQMLAIMLGLILIVSAMVWRIYRTLIST